MNMDGRPDGAVLDQPVRPVNCGGVTVGEVHHVDCGYNTVGMVAVDEARGVSDLLNEYDNK